MTRPERLTVLRSVDTSAAGERVRARARVLYPPAAWEWYGHAGHLIVGSDCRFHLATLVGPWWVSTVGEWLPDSATWDIYAQSAGVTLKGRGDARRNQFLSDVGYVEIGCDRKYETMVFRSSGRRCETPDCGCGLPLVDEWGELDSDGYNDARSAREGHLAMCAKWSSRPPESGSAWEDEPAALTTQEAEDA